MGNQDLSPNQRQDQARRDRRKNCAVTKLKGRRVDLGKQGSPDRDAVICLQDCGGSCQAEATEMHRERRKQGGCSGIDMTLTFLLKREKEDVRFRDEQISESRRAVEANASAVQCREGCSQCLPKMLFD